MLRRIGLLASLYRLPTVGWQGWKILDKDNAIKHSLAGFEEREHIEELFYSAIYFWKKT